MLSGFLVYKFRLKKWSEKVVFVIVSLHHGMLDLPTSTEVLSSQQLRKLFVSQRKASEHD